MHVWHSVGRLGGAGGGGCRGGEKKGLGQFTWMASCVPAVCQQNAEWRGERPIISHMHTLSLAFHTPNPGPCEIRRTDSAKTITPRYACMWSPPAHTHSHALIKVACGELFSLL